jgi:hypothetical protein
VPEKLKTSETCLAEVKADGRNLEYVPEKFKTPELCLTAFKSMPEAVEFMPEKIRLRIIKMALKSEIERD